MNFHEVILLVPQVGVPYQFIPLVGINTLYTRITDIGQLFVDYLVQFFTSFWQILKIGEKELVSMYKGSLLETNIDIVIWVFAVFIVVYSAIEIIDDIHDKEKGKFKHINDQLNYLNLHNDSHIDNMNLCKVNIQQLLLDMNKMKKKIVRLEKEVRKYD